ncbi:hypothetical protein WN55_01482 [Dufourea novaeangliae]|uniref:Uncharacterized protein n=1 Tax=Dufourea novaeangliae TaxID=178035 RepID=A0A154PER5_DUFNO|nr:hypothetical protein WN55_01482 [Dufourea novaeangliae]
MSCQTALYTQTVTLLSVPQEILLLQHKVFREYAKITVGPDFIHTLPSFMILAALTIVLWRNPPSSNSLAHVFGPPLYKALQDFEDRDISYQWWQRVWSSYYPPPLQPPVMSAGFISWILSMSIAVLTLSCALSTNRIWNFITDSVAELRVALVTVKHYVIAHLKRMLTCLLQHYWSQELPSMKPIVPAESEASSMCDDCRSEISSDIHNPPRMEIHPVSYGTNWTPKPCFSGYKEPQRKVSMKSLHTVAVVDNVEDSDKLTPKQLRHRRGCHTVIPSNSSDKSSGC